MLMHPSPGRIIMVPCVPAGCSQLHLTHIKAVALQNAPVLLQGLLRVCHPTMTLRAAGADLPTPTAVTHSRVVSTSA